MSQRRLPVILALGTGQTLAWGSSVYMPAILAKPIGRDLGVGTSAVFAAFSLALLISGLVGPAIGKRIDRDGGRDVLSASSLVLAAGLALLAVTSNVATLVAAWIVLGFGMGLGLYDSAFATLGRLYGASARSSITGIALMAGFASTISWPLTTLGLETVGWRWTCIAWSAAHLVIGLPLNRFGIPLPAALPTPSPAAASPMEPPVVGETSATSQPPSISFDRNMWLLSVGFAAIWFVAGAMAAHMPAIIVASGASLPQAVFAASLMGPAQVAARIVEAGLLSRYHPLFSARLASACHPISAVLLMVAGPIAAPLFAIIHGAGNGILTIARGTVPLAIYGPVNYGYRLGLLGAPARVAQAIAPLGVSLILESHPSGALVATGLVGALTLLAFLLIQVPPRSRAT